MDINVLPKGLDCSCGRHPACNIEAVYIEKGAIKRLTALCKEHMAAATAPPMDGYAFPKD